MDEAGMGSLIWVKGYVIWGALGGERNCSGGQTSNMPPSF